MLPWIAPLPDGSGFAIRNAWILLPGILLGLLLAGASHLVATRTHNRLAYWGGPILVLVVVAATVLLMYGGACGFCTKVVCPGRVQSCGIKLQLSLTFFKIYCSCYQPSSFLPLLENISRSLTASLGLLPAL